MAASENDRKIDYVEFGVRDVAASKAFYGSVFGWSFTDYGPDYCEFNDGRLKGGFTTLSPVTPGGALIVLYGDDLSDISARIVDAGGTITKPVFAFPGGHRFHFTDRDGYELAVWSPLNPQA